MELLDLILETSNLSQAITRVVENKGSSGIDGMSVIEDSTNKPQNLPKRGGYR